MTYPHTGAEKEPEQKRGLEAFLEEAVVAPGGKSVSLSGDVEGYFDRMRPGLGRCECGKVVLGRNVCRDCKEG